MLITRSPLRVSLGGGGTDLPSYSNKFGGYLISASIDKYVYVSVNRPFEEGIYLKYSKLEKALVLNDIKHPIIREALKLFDLEKPQIEITSVADIPSGTGLGSSGSFTTALLKGLFTFYRKTIGPRALAELACEIELNKLKEPVGIQDQYISAIGGIQEISISKQGTVEYNSLALTSKVIHDLEDNLLLFYTGQMRSASSVLNDQDEKSKFSDSAMLDNLHLTKELGLESKKALVEGDMNKFAEILNVHWENKIKRSDGITNRYIQEIYETAIQNGAQGGKLVGAGGGGFLMFYASERDKLRNEMRKLHLEEVRFNFDFEGAKVVML